MAKRGNFFIRLCYGYVGRYKDTSKMTTKEVIEEFLKSQGVSSPRAFFENKFKGKTKASAMQNGGKYNIPTPSDFYQTLKTTKNAIELDRRWRVDLHELEDYKNDKLFVTKGGSCIAVEPSGNIISVCQRPGDSVRGYQLLQKAIQEGGDRLDAFGPDLFDFYTNNGFEPVSWTPFNEEYAPDEWKEAKAKGVPVEKEPVIFYKYTGRYNRDNNPYDYIEFLRKVKPDADYDTALNRRDKEIK